MSSPKPISWNFIKWIFAQIIPNELSLQLRCFVVMLMNLSMIGLQLALPFVLKQLVNSLEIESEESTIIILCFAYGLLWIATRFVTEIREIISYKIFATSVSQVTGSFFEYLLNQPLSFHINKDMGALIDELKRTQYTLYKGSIGFFLTILPRIIESLATLYILWKSYPLDIAITCTIFLYAITSASITSASASINAEQLANEAENEQSNFLFDHLLNIEAIQNNAQEKAEYERLQAVLSRTEQARTIAFKEQFMMMVLHGGLTGGLLLCVSLLTGYKVLNKAYTIGDFILLNSYIISFSESISQLGKHIKNLREGIVDLQGIYEIFQTKEKSLLSDESNHGDKKIIPSNTAISFKNISFSYIPEAPLLNNISFDIYHGKTVAIVGASGSGKSTITKLLLRLYQPTQGSITIGGTLLEELDLIDLRSQIGIVPQNPVLFKDTVFNNIAYANPIAPFEEVKLAAKTAKIDEFITKLPQKYETELGELGMTISGGERQRIALARALLKHPLIFIFDEATSALDTHTETSLMSSIVNASKDKTTLMIAHRLSTIMHADHIIVLDHGKIKEQGTHAQLLELNKLYAQLWYKQAESPEA
ncbi:ABC transporter ATP-binding protein [Candidatus Dependentiae bacterium]|nr:ABC transporter ATP-binding protein [Candidatus Dependentiae bacterium]